VVASPIDLVFTAENETLGVSRPILRPHVGFDPVSKGFSRQPTFRVLEDAFPAAAAAALGHSVGGRPRSIHGLDHSRDLGPVFRSLDRPEVEP